MTPPKNGNGWDEHRRHVLAEQKRQGDSVDQLVKSVNRLCVEVAGIKSGIKVEARWTGAIWGFAAALLMVGLQVFFKSKG